MQEKTILIWLQVAILILMMSGLPLGSEASTEQSNLDKQLILKRRGLPPNQQTHETVPVNVKGSTIYTTQENADRRDTLNSRFAAIFVAEGLLVLAYAAAHRRYLKIRPNGNGSTQDRRIGPRQQRES